MILRCKYNTFFDSTIKKTAFFHSKDEKKAVISSLTLKILINFLSFKGSQTNSVEL